MTKKMIALISAFALLLSVFAAGCSSHTEEEPLVIAFVTGIDGNKEFHQKNTYNDDGLLIQEYIVTYHNGEVSETTTNRYSYDELGFLAEKDVTTYLAGIDSENHDHYTYDREGRVIAADKLEYSYELDDQNRISKVICTRPDGSVVSTEEYTYHADGSYTVDRVISANNRHDIFTKDAEGFLTYFWVTDSDDPDSGRVLQDQKYEYEKEYDENGVWLSRKLYQNGALSQRDTRTFDENGNLIHEITYTYDTDLDDNGGAIVLVSSKFYTYLPLSEVIGK